MTFEKSGGHIIIRDGSRVAFNSANPHAQLNPLAKIELSSVDITFPTFWGGVIYQQTRETVDNHPFPSYDIHGCWTMFSPVPQEWGPSAAAPHNLANVVLGSVPAGTQYLEVWVNLTQVQVPSNWLDIPFSSSFPAGQWVKLEGGSCLIEEPPGYKRLFEIVLVGTNVVLRRYQSAGGGGWTRSNPGGTAGNQTFFYEGTNAPNSASADANFGVVIDSKSGPVNTTHRPPGKENGSGNNDACSMNTSGISFASTWRGPIRIIPGRIG